MKKNSNASGIQTAQASQNNAKVTSSSKPQDGQQPRTGNKSQNRRAQHLSMGNAPPNIQTESGAQNNQNSSIQQQMIWQQQQMMGQQAQFENQNIDLGGFSKQNSQKGHLRTGTMGPQMSNAGMVPQQPPRNQKNVSQGRQNGTKSKQSQNQKQVNSSISTNLQGGNDSVQGFQSINQVQMHQKNHSMAPNMQMMDLNSPQNQGNFTQLSQKGGANQGARTGGGTKSQRRNAQGPNSNHHRGRSSGVVKQNTTGINMSSAMQNADEIQQILNQQQQQLMQMQLQEQDSQFNYQLNNQMNQSGSNQSGQNNPFRRQQKQAKYQQKYQQQLQMYSSSNRIQQQTSNNKNRSSRQQQMLQEQQIQQQIQQYNDHVRSLSNCSNGYMQGYVTQDAMNQNLINQQLMQGQRGGAFHQTDLQNRKAPSSINLLNQTSITNNLNTSNLLMPNVNGQNIANVTNMGNIAMTHQNLLIQPQISQNLLRQQVNEEKISEQQILESEEYFESGKLYLTEKKYKDASKMFSKSLQANKTNYDALFYRAVTNLDQELPEKAINDLEELMKICSDYRKTMFIVLSIAYRRVNDYLSAIRSLSKAIQKYPAYLEAYIARGQIYIFQKKWDKALNDFKTVLKYSPKNGMGYLGQGDAQKGLAQIDEAIQSYTQVIEIDPQSKGQALMKRGLLYLQQKKNEDALVDFNNLTELAEDENHEFQQTSLSKAYFYKAKALKKMNNMNDSVLYFEQVLRLAEDNILAGSALYEIAKIKIQHKDFYEAHYNLQRSAHLNLKQKKLQNYKLFTEGVIFLMKRKTKTGVKLLSQVIDRMRQKTQASVTKANMKKLEGGDKASQNSDIAGNQSQNSSTIQCAPDEPLPPTSMAGDEKDYIYPLLYIYRAYGYIVLEEYDKSLKDFIKSQQIKKLNNSQHYNMILAQGLKNLEQKEYESSIQFFTKAAQKQSKKRDPFLLRAMSLVEYTVNKPIKPKNRIQMLQDAKKDLHRALEQSPKDESVLFLRGILNFSLHRFYDAICDFERVIEKADETNAIHYLARGRCYACLSMFKEAITDLSIAINLNKNLLDAYLNRGKCAYLIGDTGLAFMDFQKLIVLEPKNPSVHIYAGNLLMTTGSYEDATKAFTNADNIKKSPLALYQRSRCHVALNNMEEALDDLNKVIDISHTDKVAIQDRECLNALKSCSVSVEQANESNTQDKQIFNKAAQGLTKLISYEKNENLAKITHESSIQHQHSQIIPSAHRTKMDKIRAIRRRKEQDRVQRENPENGRKNDLRFRVQQNNEDGEDEENDYEDISELDDAELEKLNRKLNRNESDELDQGSSDDEEESEQDANYYKENIFNKEDFYLYRSILYIYGQEYEKAIQDLETCSGIMHQNKVLYPKNQFPDKELEDGYESPTGTGNVNGQGDNMSQNSSQTDLSDVGLCSLNIHEFSFNIVLAMILAKDYAQALTKLDYIIDTIAKKYVNQFWLIRGIINDILGYSGQSKKDLKRAYKYDRENTTAFLEKNQDVKLNIFPQQQRLCSFFQYIKVDLSEFKQGTASIHLKPSFSFPFIKPPNMIPCVDQKVVLEQFNLKKSNVQLKPEAPWIKKCQFGIKFTEEILFTDDDREPTPDDEKEYKKRKQRQQERAMEGAGFIRAHSEKVELKFNIFAEDNDGKGHDDGQEEGDQEGDEGQIFVDAEGNPVNLADLDLGDLEELGDIDNLEGIDDSMKEQMKILLQKQQNYKMKMEESEAKDKNHQRNKTQDPVKNRRGKEMDLHEELELNMIGGGDLDGSPENDFNKLQKIGNLKDIAKQDMEDDDYEDDIEDMAGFFASPDEQQRPGKGRH